MSRRRKRGLLSAEVHIFLIRHGATAVVKVALIGNGRTSHLNYYMHRIPQHTLNNWTGVNEPRPVSRKDLIQFAIL